MLKKRRLKKVYIFSRNPRFSQQQSDVLIRLGDYFFHIPPTKDDFRTLPHLGALESSYRNPKTTLSLTTAKKTLQNFIGPEALTQEKKLSEAIPWYRRTYTKNKVWPYGQTLFFFFNFNFCLFIESDFFLYYMISYIH